MSSAQSFTQSFTAYPGRWVLALLFVLMVLPGLDVPVSAVFYKPETMFGWTVGGFPDLLRRVVPEAIVASAVICAVVWAAAKLGATWAAAMTTPRLAYLVTTLLVGPGLIVETVLKPNWGRARPKDIAAFGGDAAYTLPWVPAHECATNCSFVSGHAAIVFWLTAYAFLLPPKWRAVGVYGAVVLGLLMGAVRIAQGGHFLSDVAAAGFIVVLVNALLARVFLKTAAI